MNSVPQSRMLGVLIEFKLPDGGIDRGVEFIEFFAPQTGDDFRGLSKIAECRVETQLLQKAAAEKRGKNWRIIEITEC